MDGETDGETTFSREILFEINESAVVSWLRLETQHNQVILKNGPLFRFIELVSLTF